MHICLLVSVPIPPEEGIGHHVWNLARELHSKGHMITIITRGSAMDTRCFDYEGVRVWKVRFIPLYPYHVHVHGQFVNKLLRQIEDHFDLIHVHTPLPPAVRTCLPLMTTVHSPMRADTAASYDYNLRILALKLQTPISQRIEQRLFKQSRIVTAVARWVADELAYYGLDPADVEVTGNGYEQAFSIRPSVVKEPAILYVGRLDIGKGLGDLIHAAAIFTRSEPETPYRFILVGKGPLESQMHKMIDDEGLGKYFELKGHISQENREDLVLLYNRATIFVQPSHHEGMSTVILEAMACGMPVISTNVGGAPEIIQDRINGLLVPNRSPSDLAAAFLELTGDSELRSALGQNAQKTVRDLYSWTAIAKNYLACYQQLLSTRA